MSYKDVKAGMQQLDSESLKDDSYFREFQLKLMFEIYGCLDSISHSYHEMLKIQQSKNGYASRSEPAPEGPADRDGVTEADLPKTFKPAKPAAKKQGAYKR